MDHLHTPVHSAPVSGPGFRTHTAQPATHSGITERQKAEDERPCLWSLASNPCPWWEMGMTAPDQWEHLRRGRPVTGHRDAGDTDWFLPLRGYGLAEARGSSI